MIDSLINTLLVVAGLYVYLSLFRQIAVRQNGAAILGDREFGLPEAIAAICSSAGLRSTSWRPRKSEHATFQTRDLLITGVFSLAVISILTALLQLRGFSVLSLGGFSRLGFGRIVSTAAVLLFAAYPLLFAADGVSRWLLGEGSSKQQIIEMFTGSETLQQRVLIIVLAITIAPHGRGVHFPVLFIRGAETLPRPRARVGLEFAPFCGRARAFAEPRAALYSRRMFHPGL